MKLLKRKQALLSLFIAASLGGAVVADAVAQSDRSSERASRKSKSSGKAEELYPQSTRAAPTIKPSSKLGSKLQKLIETFNKGEDYHGVRTQADEILANSAANEADKALAAQLAAQAAYNTDDTAAAKKYLQQAIGLNALDNNGQFQSMLMLAQLQMQDDQQAEGLATLDKYLDESKSQRPEDLILKGQALYQAERYKEAIPVLKQAIAASPEPKDTWNQLLMAAYAEAGQTGEAVATAEAIAAKTPNDKKAQLNLASMYMQADQMDKAAAVMDKLRAAGQLTEEKEYKQLYSIYANTENKEKDVIAVINEGMQKGILKPDYQTYLALAQSYYYSEDVPKAVENWQKAAPLSKDGETYLNLAKVLHSEGRIPEAKQAAQQAIAKGVKKPEDAKKIINLK
ncbi:tetratricopeptide repeat protein [Xanthomonas hortorum]|uniref:Tetratricopeptide repeat protein n=1 Tax=Xanthomonas hortorum pv. pelargonii TaxID=453602 RepID=A0A6V7B6H3_9XANT|nr:tetratricopeptide repeat protein [Xanthomonas hortorum]MCE4355325.1 tetratricopeptide repeat protein [Xanthomonas hortorum pv. pelargonii]MCM5523211.1 tetratricopeptide repeat protein [Xanthomonas hortorum pv. pelargonii]MCM5535664.1 tetratricopeptide repeat protein [Xanthomonas hortorum pv. pelargonii]MCM5539828.1 tetratricopeptide repeat protein [Xanthomonas hortorum pv. pelargonii]MCM5543554.1 tetratricopeptide repeat protein [Xanthomonas hortorum pv. pelargonii]